MTESATSSCRWRDGLDAPLLRDIYGTLEETPIAQVALSEDRVVEINGDLARWVPERYAGLTGIETLTCTPVAAVEPGTDNAFALVLPYANTEAMQEFLDQFAATIGADEHVALILDQAGWHGAGALQVPASITLLPLPPYSPELNPVEWVWEYMKERFLSLRLHNDYDAIADAACKAWNRLRAETGRITSLCSHPWIMEVKP